MTFTFITFSDRDTFAERTVTVRSDAMRKGSTRHLDRFKSGRNWDILAIHQVDSPSLAEAKEWFALAW